jgi:hypothetical protein
MKQPLSLTLAASLCALVAGIIAASTYIFCLIEVNNKAIKSSIHLAQYSFPSE